MKLPTNVLPYLKAYKAHIFFTKYIFSISKCPCVLYAICKSAEISHMATPICLDFCVIFIYLLSLFTRLLCRLKVLSLIIFMILISSRLILVLCFFVLICPAEIGVRLILTCVLYAFKNGTYKSYMYIHLNVCKQMTNVKLLLSHRFTWNHLTLRKQMIDNK